MDPEFTRCLVMAALADMDGAYSGNVRDAAAYLAVREKDAEDLIRDLPARLEDLAELYDHAGRAEKAAQVMQLALDAGYDGSTPDARCFLAEFLMHAGRTREAEAIWAQVKADTPDDVWLYNVAGMAYQQIGDHGTAMTWLTEGLRLALAAGDPERLSGQLWDLRAESMAALGREPDQLQARAEEYFGHLAQDDPPGQSGRYPGQLISWPEVWAALDTARAEEQQHQNPWHGVFRRLLAHSVMVAIIGETTAALLQKQSAQPVAGKIAEALPGGLPQLKSMAAWRLGRQIAKEGSWFRGYNQHPDKVIAFAQLAEAALGAYAAGIVPATPAEPLPGENDHKARARDWPRMPVIPDSIDRGTEAMSLLNEADVRLREVFRARELASGKEQAEHLTQDEEEAFDRASQWPEFLGDWADAAAYTLATTLRETLPRASLPSL